MNPSNETMVRFIAFYERGPENPVTKLVLGYGFQDMGGTSHRQLIPLYMKVDLNSDEEVARLYAGYLYLNEGQVRVAGGSGTLYIRPSSERDQVLSKELNTTLSKNVRGSVRELFALITANKLRNIMLACY
jgi:hypothetical protein